MAHYGLRGAAGIIGPAAPRIAQRFCKSAKKRGPRRFEPFYLDARPSNGSGRQAVPAPETVPSAPPDAASRILVADRRVPHPDEAAGDHATLGLLIDLAAFGYKVTFLATDMRPIAEHEETLRRHGIEVITAQSGFERAVDFIGDQGHRFGVFYLIRFDVAELLLNDVPRFAPWARDLLHAPDIHFLRERRPAALRRDDVALTRAMETRSRELSVMRWCDHVVVVSHTEREVLEEAQNDVPISVVRALYTPVVESPRGFGARQDIFFLGGFHHAPNEDAVI